MRTTDEIIEALKTIKETCGENHVCDDCPFYMERKCYIQDSSPVDWNILDGDKKVIWRAFK